MKTSLRFLHKKSACLILLLLGCALSISAQVTVTGTVNDGKEPLIGVTIVEQGTTNGATTDIDGNYSITVSGENSTLTFSFVGFESQSVVVGTQTEINIQMVEDFSILDEVVVVGYGVVKRKDLTGSSVSVGGDKIQNLPVTTAAQALAGKVAGVNIVSQSGAPGADVNILIRGGTSITQSSKPLYVVDGFVMEDGLKNIDINDIESIDIMKDASATAIYGARGSNGVIHITTKSAKRGKTQVNYNMYYSFEKLSKSLDVLSVKDYVKYQYEFQHLAGNEESWASIFGGGDPANSSFYPGIYDYIDNTYGSKGGIDWQDLVFGGSSLTQNHNVNITTGNDKSKVMLSYNYTNQDGIMARHGYNKNGIRAKFNHNFNENIRLDFNTSYQSTKVEGGGSLDGALKMTILQPPTGGTRYTDEQMISTDISEDMMDIDSQYDIYNPIIMNNSISKNKYTRLLSSNAGVEVDFLRDFTFRTAGSYTWKQTRDDSWDDGGTPNARNYGGPYGSRNNSEKYTWQITNTLSWRHYYGLHFLNVMVGQETYYHESMKLNNEYHNFPENNFGLNDVSMGTIYSSSSGMDKEGIVSGFGRVVYNYNSKYLVTGTLRGDGSSKFYKDNQWGFFPSMALAWRISEESFMDNLSFVDDLKLRLGYGTSGNCNIDNNMYSTDYKTGHYAINREDFSTLIPGNVVGNRSLQWETVTSTNLGFDLAVLKSRLNMTIDLYNNKSENLLIKNKIPNTTGFTYQFQNVGSIQNRGVELVINSTNVNKRDFSWTTNFNISFNRSKVLTIYDEGDDKSFLKNYSSRIDFLIEEGQPLGQFYGYKYDGIYTTDDFVQNNDGTYALRDGVPSLKGKTRSSIKPGDVKYILTAEEEQVDDDGNPIWSTDDRIMIGNAEPKFIGGIGNTFAYKGFDLRIFMNFVYGNKIFNMSSQRFIGPYLPNENSLTVMNDRFVLVDPATGKETTDLGRLAELNPQQYDKDAMWSLHSDNKIAITDALDYYLEDGSYLRISDITLGYTLPNSVLSKAHITNMRIYCSLNNIYTFTKYSGYDPEVAAEENLLTRGVDNSSYPRSKSWVVGLNLTF
jgi:TonB-dependent starch-binding outer membrane protein SusC